ncbi:MAG: thermonuclease family protein [Limnobacter sp.]|jgi:micrococcal nuclease
MLIIKKGLIGAALWLGFALTAVAVPSAGSVEGRVLGVSDGDTIYMMVNGERVRMRLAEVDAPEKGQPFGSVAEKILQSIVRGKHVRAVWRNKDGNNRPVVRLELGDMYVNAELVRLGFAWVDPRYLRTDGLEQYQVNAQQAKLGLWADPDPIPPWTWRKMRK